MSQRVQHTAVVPYTSQEMFQLVNDIPLYATFLPGCLDSEVLEATDQQVTARLRVGQAGLSKSFVTRNTLSPPDKIEIALVEGPFRSLTGEWTFQALNDTSCKVSLDLEFELENGFLKSVFSKIFEKANQQVVDAFVKRAAEIYGKRSLD